MEEMENEECKVMKDCNIQERSLVGRARWVGGDQWLGEMFRVRLGLLSPAETGGSAVRTHHSLSNLTLLSSVLRSLLTARM